MKEHKIGAIIIASSFALLALFILQVKWLIDSKNLIEEQFDQKVSMALCAAVDEINGDSQCCLATTTALPIGCEPTINSTNETFTITTGLDRFSIENAIAEAMLFYDIHTNYSIEILPKEKAAIQSPYCCSIQPFSGSDQFLNITFSGKTAYVLEKMGFMLIASILILVFITMTFVMTNYALLKQKRISQINVDFFNNMAHEFKTPLANIKLATSLLQRKNKELKGNRYTRIVERESQTLLVQIERILQLAKMENGSYQLEKEQLSLNALLQEVLEELSIQINEKQAQVQLLNFNKEIFLIADAFHLHNAFRNVIENALKYCKSNPKIDITLVENKTGVHVEIQDNGIGIPKCQQAFIFNKFHRVNEGNLYHEKGVGLGLAYVKMVIERHKGMVSMFSELHKGSRFQLFLPFQ